MPFRPSPLHLSPESALPELDLPDGVSCWSAELIDEKRRNAKATNNEKEENFLKALCQTIDILGLRSQLSQQVNYILTSVSRLHENKTFRLYLLVSDKRGIGILKVGVKKLFVTHPVLHALVEVDPLCILDFYVSEQCQRRGFGLQLFKHMIEAEHVKHAEHLAIDRPSDKFMAFLAKHYHLKGHALQVNNFVVFNRFFDNTRVTERNLLCRLPSLPQTGQNVNTNVTKETFTIGSSATINSHPTPPEEHQESCYSTNTSTNTINNNIYGNMFSINNASMPDRKSRFKTGNSSNPYIANSTPTSYLLTGNANNVALKDHAIIPHLTPTGCRAQRRTEQEKYFEQEQKKPSHLSEQNVFAKFFTYNM